MEKVAFLCLGRMGYPMAGHLSRAGHDVRVYNRNPERAQQWVAEYGGEAASTPAEAAHDVDVVLVCTGNDDDLGQVLRGERGALRRMKRGSLLIDHTTASARIAKELADEGERGGVDFLDAPVSGGEEGAKKGVLTTMVGGSPEAFERAQPLFDCYAKTAVRLGPAGSGQLTKMVNQICIAGLVEGLAEGLAFAERAGLDAARVVEVISKGAAQSWQMDHRAAPMLEGAFDFGFAVDWMRKDLAIALEEARRNGARLPVAALVDQLYAEVQRRGGGRWDTSSLMALLSEGPASGRPA
ncbi:MAG: NAD(P)-dependent oxidoreductase [Deltaproteobacteria bacterium]|nr:NAD(P)-dependent oxidoreductase [Deltaproteobacteria bacterium]MBW2445253.1 NAD(P)-dependent oxidoreductase [Deltaproteobacteria bacterium]